jgi:hypothetical protein
MMLNSDDMDAVALDRATSFNPDYWNAEIGDRAHFKLVMELKRSPDYRLLYDSWLWRDVIKRVAPCGAGSRLLELLPGASLTIPAALESVGFSGTLDRFNDEPPVPLPAAIGFPAQWKKGDIADLLSIPLAYDLILGNHIIDDLLFSLFCPEEEVRRSVYSDSELCKETWKRMAGSGSLPSLQSQIVAVFAGILKRMPPASLLILRHYPSTFALASRDLTRINAEMDAYFAVAGALLKSGDAITDFFDLSGIQAPPGSKYPKSVLVLRKKG